MKPTVEEDADRKSTRLNASQTGALPICVLFDGRLHLVGSRKFDIVYLEYDADLDSWEHAHPHILPKVTIGQMEQLFTSYHVGRKFDIALGKYKYEKPVALQQEMPLDFQWGRAILEEIVAAPSLLEACSVGEVRARTVADVKSIRDESEAAKRAKYTHKYDKASFLSLGPPSWTILWVHGATNLGKTKWAAAQFENPLLIKPFTSVGALEAIKKQFNPKFHDGIVCDEADLRFMGRENVISFFDADDDATLDVRYTHFTLPPIKKIITTKTRA